MTSPAPRRRPSPAVYRRRRLVLLLAVLVVAAVITLLIWQPWNGAPASRTTPTPSVSPSASLSGEPLTPSGAPTPDATIPESPDAGADADASPAVAECNEGSVEVAPVTDKDSYAPGETPQLSITLTNRSAAPCTINVGTTTQTFTIVSGNDVWWRSTDCQSAPSDQIVTLEAGQTVSSVTPLVWDRTRSSVDTCGSGDRPAAPAGGSSFHLAVSIGGLDAGQTKQFLLY